MDALIFLAAFAVVTWGLWALGAHGLAVAFGGIGVWVAVVEGVWVLRYRRTISQEVGHIWGKSKARFIGVLLIVGTGAVGLLVHFLWMRK